MVGAGGLSYEEAAKVCGCAVGTVKSRVARARQALERMLSGSESGRLPSRGDVPTGTGDDLVEEARRRSGTGGSDTDV